MAHQLDGSLVTHTADLWSRRGGRAVDTEDARQIVGNVSGFLGVLAEWDSKEPDEPDGPQSSSSDARNEGPDGTKERVQTGPADISDHDLNDRDTP